MKTLDEIIASVRPSPPAKVFDIQEERDKQTIDRAHELFERMRHTGSADTLKRLEEWLWWEYDAVSKAQGARK